MFSLRVHLKSGAHSERKHRLEQVRAISVKMADLSNLLSTPKFIVRFVLALASMLGSIGANPGMVVGHFSEVVVIDLAISGGALVAIALLLCSVEGEEVDVTAQIVFDVIYAILCLAAFILAVLVFVRYTSLSTNIGCYVMLIGLLIALVCWIIDLVILIKGLK